MRVSPLALLACGLLAAPSSSQDMGEKVTFARRPSVKFSALMEPGGSGRFLYDSGASDPLAGPGRVLFFHGISPDPGVSFHVGRELKGGWDGGQAEVHRRPGGRFWARARLPAGGGPVRLWAYDSGITFDHEVEIFGVELGEEAPELPASTAPMRVPARPPQPDAPRPAVHERAQWGAAAPTEAYTPFTTVWRLTLHHTDGRYTRTLEESLEEVRFIQDFHQRGRGWIDIAYHFLIDEAGRIIEGRPESVQGAHTLDNNEGNIGICLLGKYQEPAAHRPTAAQLDAVARIARYGVLRHGVDPAVEFKGHRDYRSTDCPGDHGYARLPELRLRADGRTPPGARRGVRPRPLPASAPPFAGAFSWDGQRRMNNIAVPSASR